MLRYAMLCYAMLCYVMLCCAMLCYAMLCYAMLCYAILYHQSFLRLIEIINYSTYLNSGTHTVKYINYETHEQCLLDNSHDWKWLDEDAVEVLIKKKVDNIVILCCHVQYSTVHCVA